MPCYRDADASLDVNVTCTFLPKDFADERCESRSSVFIWKARDGVRLDGIDSSRIHVNEIPQQRIDFGIPLLAAENPIVADPSLHVMHLAIGAHAGAEILGGECLAD